MMYKTFTRYTPEEPLSGVAYLQSEEGLDWYTLRESLVDSDALKIAYQADGIIRQQTYDGIRGMFPENLSVAVINKKSVPLDFPENADGQWIFNGKKITPRVIPESELIAQAEETRGQLMAKANQKITPLQDALDLNMATDEELAQLKAWKTYRVLLNRVDTSTAPDVDWPVAPSI
ncbi:tail fiber assembly protein [Hafnia paralvei]|uniref:tail fiber assembly protein n=1 Tax=Hafnia paralvei TaxID=546367 RepID=UPI001F339F27|nr:tail fiber assembly protein [Hafnia paralvei]EHP5272030.1 tail fiber assembly protein [Escherichia coli]MCE9902514.1 tail fiber assembly protein [Hafnia paralvei]MCE9921787.1 tail fiber assembly protein [Hafnia paralvei]